MKSKLFFLVIILMVLCYSGIAYAGEEITLTTYYPAPYGEYNSLAVGDPTAGYTATNDGELLVEGNVGIGTTSPGAKLEVRGTDEVNLILADEGDNYNEGDVQSQLAFAGRYWSGDPNPGVNSYIMSHKGSPSGNGGSHLSFWTQIKNSATIAERMRITSTGNVGIGTASPGAKLHIGGTAGTDGIMFPDGTLQTTAGGVPVGSIMPYAGSSAPSGWLLCNGSTLTQGGSGQIYKALYDVIGTTYGGTGANDFKLPDLRGRAAIGAGTGVGLSPRTLADEIGEENHQLTINEMPSHTHLLLTNEYRDTNTDIIPGSNDYIAQRGQGSNLVNYGEYDISKGSGMSPNAGKAKETGGGATHNNMQPSLVLNFIIKY